MKNQFQIARAKRGQFFIDFSSQGQFIPNLPDSTCYYGLIVKILEIHASYKNKSYTNTSLKKEYLLERKTCYFRDIRIPGSLKGLSNSWK